MEGLPKEIAGRYRPLRVLGEGGMGVVYAVEHIRTGEQLALKILHAHSRTKADRAERMRKEARAYARIRSEHVVRVTDADVAPELDGAPFLVMELLEGQDLAARLDEGPVSPEECLVWITQLARALDKAHGLGLIHRDLKPENLFLTQSEDGATLLKVLDFGLVKIAGDETNLTRSGEIVGTPLYMAPEQALGHRSEMGLSADVWSVGMVVYRILSGEAYWDGATATHVLAKLVTEELEAPSARGCDLGPAFDQWFLRSCATEPKSRYGSAGEQVKALAGALGLAPPEASSGAHSLQPTSRERSSSSSLPVSSSAGRSSELSFSHAHTLPGESLPSSPPPRARANSTLPLAGWFAAILLATFGLTLIGWRLLAGPGVASAGSTRADGLALPAATASSGRDTNPGESPVPVVAPARPSSLNGAPARSAAPAKSQNTTPKQPKPAAPRTKPQAKVTASPRPEATKAEPEKTKPISTKSALDDQY